MTDGKQNSLITNHIYICIYDFFNIYTYVLTTYVLTTINICICIVHI